VTIELANLKIKNDELNSHLSSAERFIESLEKRIEELVQSDQSTRNALLHEREVKSDIERVVLTKDALIQKQGREFSEEIANRDRMIENLERRLAEVNRLQPSPTQTQAPSQ
jgi:septation ring formation regulator EzrA